MTLKEIVEKAEHEIGGVIVGIGECEDRWILVFDFQEATLSSVVWCCYKATGKIGYFFPPDEPGLLKTAKPIELPTD